MKSPTQDRHGNHDGQEGSQEYHAGIGAFGVFNPALGRRLCLPGLLHHAYDLGQGGVTGSAGNADVEGP